MGAAQELLTEAPEVVEVTVRGKTIPVVMPDWDAVVAMKKEIFQNNNLGPVEDRDPGELYVLGAEMAAHAILLCVDDITLLSEAKRLLQLSGGEQGDLARAASELCGMNREMKTDRTLDDELPTS